MDINLEYYRTFYYIAKYKSTTLAANYMCVSQSAISQTLKKLERQLGCTLFIRSPGGLVLSKQGEQLYKQIAEPIERFRTISEHFTCQSDAGGVLHIAAVETALYSGGFDLIHNFKIENPNADIHITIAKAPEILSLLTSGAIDLAFISDLRKKTSNVILKRMKEFELVFVCAPSFFAELKHKTLSLQELTRYPLICHEEGTATRDFLDDEFKNHGLILQPKYAVHTSTLIPPLVKRGLGIGILPECFAVNESFDILQVTQKLPPRNIYLAYSNAYPQTYFERQFRKMVANT